MIVEHTTQHLFLIHDGARYHTSQATRQFLEAHSQRITVYPLPSYSPDYNPIEYLWKKTKQRATHNQYCKEFIQLTVSGCTFRTLCRPSEVILEEPTVEGGSGALDRRFHAL